MTATGSFVKMGVMQIAEKLTGRVFLIAFITLFTAGCTNEPPDGVIPTETFAEIYAALVENERLAGAEAFLNTRMYDADSTLARFGVTRDQVQETIEYYNEDLSRWHGFYVEAMQRIEWGPGKENLPKAGGKESQP